GVSNNGVSAATPASPYFLQILTNFLFLSEKRLLRLKYLLMMYFLISSPKKANARTTVIIPATVVRMVVTIFSLARYPPTGPRINLSILEKYTGIARASSSHINSRCSFHDRGIGQSFSP